MRGGENTRAQRRQGSRDAGVQGRTGIPRRPHAGVQGTGCWLALGSEAPAPAGCARDSLGKAPKPLRPWLRSGTFPGWSFQKLSA